ncbi:sugar transporter [Algibacter amylolyticus]|uniref:Sugar transporter n=1 Tax=Algibacter amylolyticus TaxID=1608400 RepID=A0A5M7B4S9_9FLAO|nr:polysaccharide biosynthesis/export family protein [Algibacter amylolyticus]KAA5822454.1 sugar transporter [Algibacter amylolyticus]MBB5269177.1 polysaccharide export outer membrane protein [Algibacter amylolyticus]TSJ73604.1 sugar transporter [Algibacter amylolyticus]
MKPYFVITLLVFSLLCTSCISNKDVVYLQDKDGTGSTDLVLTEIPKPYRVQVSDILSIIVKALDPELVGIFNPVGDDLASGQSQASLYFNGFTIDMHGNIEFPILGEINVLGFTIEEIEDKVKSELLKQYFKEDAELFVTVNLAGLRYTVTGEGGGGVYTLLQDKVNIIEALANAGDLPDTADRTDILIVRQYPGGQKIHHIDLTDIKAMQSPYYYIQPNDMIMIKPLKRKALGAGQTAIQNITTIASILSVLVSTYFLTRNL